MDNILYLTQVEYESLNPHIPVTLKVLTESATFDVDVNGVIWTKTKLDYESQNNYTLNVSLSDGSTTDYATVFIKVTDINDNPPVFVSVPEDKARGSELLTVSATDLDAGANALVTYRIVNQQPPTSSPMFLVNSTTGQLFLSQQLDYETTKQFDVEVEASDGGQPSLSTKTLVVVHILDVNDNPPKFDQAAYDIFVLENIQKGSPVYSFSVTDEDEVGTSCITRMVCFSLIVNDTISLRFIKSCFFLSLLYKEIAYTTMVLVNWFGGKDFWFAVI
uniref:Cadherin domain-containing protein n=2 Tax=Anser TaxID=8842 RepID=A0A8B9D2X4_9AVES